MNNAVLTDWIKARSQEVELVLSVCTGALLMAKAGLLDGLEATTHHGAIDLLREVAPKTTVHADRRFVDIRPGRRAWGPTGRCGWARRASTG
jgi:transcriptional regulator GlxA family with amidase domain